MSAIATRIRVRRKQLQISQEELAEALGTTQSQISRYEKGENDPTGEMLAALATTLETSADWLLGLTEDVNGARRTKSDLTPDELELLGLYRGKPVDKRRQIIEVARVL